MLATRTWHNRCLKCQVKRIRIERMNAKGNEGRLLEVGKTNFESEVLCSKQPVLVVFCAPWSSQLATATANIGAAKSDLFPKFFLTGSAGFQSVNASDWFTGDSKFWSVGPTMQWRIFDAGRVRSNIKVQNARQEETLAAY